MNSHLQRIGSSFHRFVASQGLRRTLAVIGVTVLVAAAAFYLWLRTIGTPDVDDIQAARHLRPSVLLAADGRQLAKFRQSQQQWITLEEMSPYIVKALVATEDRRFYDHGGIDYSRTVAAVFHTLGGDAQGGSTITQQLARNLFPEEIGRSRTLTRKLKEMMTAVDIEKRYSKKEILETYLNTVPFLYNVTGIEMAARTYYGKSASQLGLLESAMLVGMLKGTHYYNPTVNPERALQRRNVVLSQMVKYGGLPPQTFAELKTKPLQLHFARQIDTQDESTAHFIVYARRWLANWSRENHINLSGDGLIIETTIDPELQDMALKVVGREADALQKIADVEWARAEERTLSRSPDAYAKMHARIEPFHHFWNANPALVNAFIRESDEFKKAVGKGAAAEDALLRLKHDAGFMKRLRASKTRLETGFVAIDPQSGEVKAWVGSRDFREDQYDHVAQAARQPGSTFKPLVYGAALEKGLSPDQVYRDTPVTIRMRDTVWRPTDMSGWSGRDMTLREGLIYSKNTITAQVMQDVGLQSIIDLAQAAGINQSRLDPVPSLALGTSPVSLLEMVSVYATVAQLGEYRQPIVIKRIRDRNGEVIAEFGTGVERAMSYNTAVELIDMMRGVVEEGTGQAVRSRFGIAADVAGKTGTTQNNTDGWFIMMHPNLVAGAWVGFNDPRVTMRSEYWGQGGHNAILVVGDFFREALKKKMIDAKLQFPRPERAPVYVVRANPVQDWRDALDGDEDGAAVAQAPAGTGIIVRRENGRMLVGDAQGIESLSRSYAESRKTGGTARSRRGVEYDPVSGDALRSSGGGGARSAAGAE